LKLECLPDDKELNPDFGIVKIKFREIRPDNTNPRHLRDPDADLSLKRLMDSHPLQDMMWIYRQPDGLFGMADGHRRYDNLVEDGYLDSNPTMTCILLFDKDDPDALLTERHITKWRLLREKGKEKWKPIDYYRKAIEHAESEKELGRPYFETARQDLDWDASYMSRVKSVVEDPVLSDFLTRGSIFMHTAKELINIPAEAQNALVERQNDISDEQLPKVVKLVKEGTPVVSAIESVKHPKEQIPDTAQESLSEGAPNELPVDDGGGSESEKDEEKQPPSETDDIPGQDFGREVISKKKPEREDCPTCNGNAYLKQGGSQFLCPDCHGKGFVLDEKPEREAQPSSESPLEVGTEPPLDTEPEEGPEPPEETKPEKKTEPKVIKFVNRMQNLGVAVDSHMRSDELEGLDDSVYRKLLNDYEEAIGGLEHYRDFLNEREANGSTHFNRAKRLHNAMREFNPHMTAESEAEKLRSMTIQTKKKLTDHINIFDNIIKNANNKTPDQEEMM
jgi:predicted RNA-binding Zn-ribbon protein involved in translation (DUF1610 family)